MTTTGEAGTVLAVIRPDGALVRVQLAKDADALLDAVLDHGRVIAEAAQSHGVELVVTLTHEAAAFAAMEALEAMSDEPIHVDGDVITLLVAERDGAIMEAARRLSRAGVGARDLIVRTPVPMS